MDGIGRYTTPTHTFTLPFEAASISQLAIVYKQLDKVVMVKDLGECTLGEKSVSVTLSEAETSLFKPELSVFIQLRVGIGASRLNSNILTVSVEDVLKEGMLDDL